MFDNIFVKGASAIFGDGFESSTVATIYDNGGLGLVGDHASPSTSTLGAGLFVGADDFVLGEGASTISRIEWWGGYGSDLVPPTDDFTVRIFADNGSGAPEQAPSIASIDVGSANRVDTGQLHATGQRVFRYFASIAPLSLKPDTTYYLSVVNRIEVVGGTGWGWSPSANSPGLQWGRRDDTGPWAQAGAIGRAFDLVSGSGLREPH